MKTTLSTVHLFQLFFEKCELLLFSFATNVLPLSDNSYWDIDIKSFKSDINGDTKQRSATLSDLQPRR